MQGMPADSDAGRAVTSIHLVLYNLPTGTTTLPEGMTQAPPGAVYGPNVHGPAAAYAGPHTHDANRHAYHTQVFALDIVLAHGDGQSFSALKAAMTGHVLASGDLVGYAAKPATAAIQATDTPIRVETGLLSGVPGRDPSISVYKGIPYAAPPVGSLRWRAPAAPLAWQGVRKADAFGPACPQPGGEMARGMAQAVRKRGTYVSKPSMPAFSHLDLHSCPSSLPPTNARPSRMKNPMRGRPIMERQQSIPPRSTFVVSASASAGGSRPPRG